MENNEKNQNTTCDVPHILVRTHRFENDLFFLSNEGSWHFLTINLHDHANYKPGYEATLKVSWQYVKKTVFENNFSAAVFSWKCVKTKNTSSCLIYSIESSKVTRLVYLGDNTMFVNERLFMNTSVFSEKPTHPVFCHLWLRTGGLTCFGVCERSQQDVCRMIVTASSVLSPAT